MRRRHSHVACLMFAASLAIPAAAEAQQSTPQAPPAAAAQVSQGPPPDFQLNPIQQAYLDQVLEAWELRSAQINTFSCPFERWDFNAFKPANNLPHTKEKGTLSYHKPDRGSFQITEVRKWEGLPEVPKAQGPPRGVWNVDPNAIGEHWVCDGKLIYEFRPNQKQLVVTPIPPELQGKEIVNGPLPFLFGAEADKLKARYWMKIHEQSNEEEIWLVALPKFQADAANFQRVTLVLDRQQLLPSAMQIAQPGGTHVDYLFDFANATINGKIDQLFQALFQAPRTPWGWQRVEQEMPQGPPQPPPQPRQAEVPAARQ